MDQRVVLRYRDGRTERAYLDPIDLDREVLSVRRDEGAPGEVPFSELKAVFFPQTNTIDPAAAPGGMRVAIEFNDGEVIRGSAHYNPEKNGFFLFPDDRSKNDRIFVVNSAIVSVEVEKL